MPDYVPPPEDLDALNPIQRYLQKGQLEFQDYMRLVVLVLAYYVLRPYIDAAFRKWFSNDDVSKGEEAQQDYRERRAEAKVSPNAIRGGKEESVFLEADLKDEVVTTGIDAKQKNTPVNRKTKLPAQLTPEELLEWDDEPAREPVKGGQTDVMNWLDKWDE